MAVRIPWWAKIGAKVLLSRIPLGFRVWQSLGLFRHGFMDTADYALSVFETHVARAKVEDNLHGKTILEIGPGDSISTAIIAYAFGANAILLDSGYYARDDMRPYHMLCQLLKQRNLKYPNLSDVCTVEQVLEICGGQYFTDGFSSWSCIPDSSVDFVFSQAVLEHVRRHEFLDTQKECFRVIKPGGVASHRVDLKDHLGGGLNNLRFSEGIWESGFFVRSGFYTNRIQFNEMLRLFEDAGFDMQVSEVRRWKELPIQRKQLAAEFRDMPDDELNVSGFDVLLKCPPS